MKLAGSRGMEQKKGRKVQKAVMEFEEGDKFSTVSAREEIEN